MNPDDVRMECLKLAVTMVLKETYQIDSIDDLLVKTDRMAHYVVGKIKKAELHG